MKKKIMLKKLLLLSMLLYGGRAVCQSVYAMNGFCMNGGEYATTQGQNSSNFIMQSWTNVFSNGQGPCYVTVYLHDTITKATIYSDDTGPTPLANPFTASTNSQWLAYAAAGSYDVTTSGPNLPTVTYSGLIAASANSGGTGTVTSFSAGNLPPLFTISVANATTTPALSFSLSNAVPYSWLGNATGNSAAPAFNQKISLSSLGASVNFAPSTTGQVNLDKSGSIDANTGSTTGFVHMAAMTNGGNILLIGDWTYSTALSPTITIGSNSALTQLQSANTLVTYLTNNSNTMGFGIPFGSGWTGTPKYVINDVAPAGGGSGACNSSQYSYGTVWPFQTASAEGGICTCLTAGWVCQISGNGTPTALSLPCGTGTSYAPSSTYSNANGSTGSLFYGCIGTLWKDFF